MFASGEKLILTPAADAPVTVCEKVQAHVRVLMCFPEWLCSERFRAAVAPQVEACGGDTGTAVSIWTRRKPEKEQRSGARAVRPSVRPSCLPLVLSLAACVLVSGKMWLSRWCRSNRHRSVRGRVCRSGHSGARAAREGGRWGGCHAGGTGRALPLPLDAPSRVALVTCGDQGPSIHGGVWSPIPGRRRVPAVRERQTRGTQGRTVGV